MFLKLFLLLSATFSCIYSGLSRSPCRQYALNKQCMYGKEFDWESCQWKCNEIMDDVVLTSAMKEWVMQQEIGITPRAGSVLSRWNNRPQQGFYRIPYMYSPQIDQLVSRKAVINKALSVINSITCIKFEPAVSGDQDIIEFIDGTGCYSYVGRNGGVQQISIGLGCGNVGTALHECLHALGFWHEHSRADRDSFVKIVWQNIQSGQEHNFFKRLQANTVSFNSSYDFQSIMHYSSYAFSNNRQPTIVNRSSGLTFDVQRSALSVEDQHQVRDMYSCDKTRGIPKTTSCYHPIDRGFSYSGTISKTVSGKTCQRWDATTPHIPSYKPYMLTGAGLHENYCRNPTTDDHGPWCYTTDPLIRWEYCSIPKCNPAVQPVKEPIPFGALPGFWTYFGSWSACSQTCGKAIQYRTRSCIGSTEGSITCPGKHWESRACSNLPACKIKATGTWGNWSDWSECTRPCGNGRHYRVRNCTETLCNGPVYRKTTCNNQPCPLYKGRGCFNKTDKSSYRGRISVSSSGKICIKWKKTEINKNTYPTANLKKNHCRNPELKPLPYCFVDKNTRENCSVPDCNEVSGISNSCPGASWTPFSPFSACSASCGGGYQFHVRQCMGGVVNQGSCKGKVWNREKCNTHSCPITNSTGPTPPPTEVIPTTEIPQPPNCATLGNATLYRGNVSKTYSGINCQRWDTLHPHPHTYRTLDHITNAGLYENYCRAPESSDTWPWCYALSYNVIKAPCDVPECIQEPAPVKPGIGCLRENGAHFYRGGQSTTRDGLTCQRWDLNSPHAHLLKSFNYPVHGLGPHNYCRSVNFGILWCFTTDPEKLWDYCDVPSC